MKASQARIENSIAEMGISIDVGAGFGKSSPNHRSAEKPLSFGGSTSL
jgi:hypothetical protein